MHDRGRNAHLRRSPRPRLERHRLEPRPAAARREDPQLERAAGLTDKGRCQNTVAFPDLRRGKVVLFIATLLARLHRPGVMPAFQRYVTMDAAYAAATGQLAYYRAPGAAGRPPLDQGRRGARRPRPRLAGRRELADAAARLHPEHGGGRPGPVARAGAGMVGRRPAHHRPGPLRRQPLRPRHRHRGRPVPAGPGAAEGDGEHRHDPRRDPPVRPVLRRGAGHLRRPGARQPPQQPHAGAQPAPAHRRADQAPDRARGGHRRRLRQLDAGSRLGPRRIEARSWSNWKRSSITSTASASSPATPATPPSAPTSTAASAGSSRPATSTPSPTCRASPTCSRRAATRRRTSRASCTATGCGSSRRRGNGKNRASSRQLAPEVPGASAPSGLIDKRIPRDVSWGSIRKSC